MIYSPFGVIRRMLAKPWLSQIPADRQAVFPAQPVASGGTTASRLHGRNPGMPLRAIAAFCLTLTCRSCMAL